MFAKLKLYGVIALVIALGLSIAYIGLLRAEIADMQRQAAEHEKKLAEEYAEALRKQREAFSAALNAEERRRVAVEAHNRQLIAQTKKLRDYHEKMADSLRVLLNGVFDHARTEYGGVRPEDPGSPSASRTDAGKQPAGRGNQR